MTNSKCATFIQPRPELIYLPFEGPIERCIPELIAKGRKIISPKELMIQRLSGLKGDKDFLARFHVYTSLAVVPNPSGDEIKLCHNLPVIYEINPKAKIRSGALEITQELYDTAEGLMLTGSEVKPFLGLRENYSQPKTREKVWEYFAEGDTKLFRKYRSFVCKKSNGSFDDVMGLWLPEDKGLRLLCIDSINDYQNHSSGASCINDLDGCDSGGRLIGVAGSELIAQTLEETLAYARPFVPDDKWKDFEAGMKEKLK